MDTNIQKINPLYLSLYIFAPILVCVISYLICYLCFYDGGTGAAITTVIPTLAAIAWWGLGGTILFKRKTKELEKRFVSEGHHPNQTFYARGETVIVDSIEGVLGIVFFWNPFVTYIIPATRVTNAWVDDGRMGAGILEGSSQVNFSFCLDNKIKIRAYTFRSNQRFTMKDRRIITGIAKAETMVKALETAKQVAESSKDKPSPKGKQSADTKKSAGSKEAKAQKDAKETEDTKDTKDSKKNTSSSKK